MDDVLPFGRHQGYRVEEIIKDRPDYISWLIVNTSLKFTQSVHDYLTKCMLRAVPRKKRYFYDGSARGEMAHMILTQMEDAEDWDWVDETPF